MRRTPALIIGGGPAGAATAIGLAVSGMRPLLVERDAETRDALCGGFLSWATVARLERLGVDPWALGAQRIDRLGLFAGMDSAEAYLPTMAAALSRRALDTALLARAEAAGAGIERGVTVREIDGDHVRLADGGTLAAEHLVLATGKHDLRGHARPRFANPTMGLRWRLGPSATLDRLVAGRIELHLFRGGYAGLVLQEDGSANLCLAVRQHRLTDANGRPDALLARIAADAPALAARLDATGAITSPQAIAAVPYGWRVRPAPAAFYRVGDQAGVIPSLAGEGIAIAIASGEAVTDAITAGLSPRQFQQRLARRLYRPILLAELLWRMAETRVGGRAMLSAARVAPGLAGLAARMTRVE